MKLIPYESLIIDSSLSPGEASARLAEATDPKKVHTFMPFHQSPGEFRASFTNTGFYLQRANTSRHAISVRGRFHAITRGTRVEARITLHGSVGLFLIFWCGLTGAGIISMIHGWYVTGDLDKSLFLLIGMLVVGYLWAFVGWRAEANNVRKFLYLVFCGRPAA